MTWPLKCKLLSVSKSPSADRLTPHGKNGRMRKKKGFSLIELLIVVAIILVIAAIAIPNLLRARMAANDSSAAGSIHALNVAEAGYFSSYQTVRFPLNLTPLGGAEPCSPGIATAWLLANGLATNGGRGGER